MNIVPPIVVFEEGWCLYVFRSEADLQLSLEPWFADGVDNSAFDSRGRELELFADPPVVRRRLIGPLATDNAHTSTMNIRPLEQAPGHANELATRLREYLACPPPRPRRRWFVTPRATPLPTFTTAQLARMDLGTLLERVIDRDGFTR